jgi:hypothetical protein
MAHQPISPGAAIQRIGARAANEKIIARPPGGPIVPGAGVNAVCALPAMQHVGTVAAIQTVVTLMTGKKVIPGPGLQQIIAGPAGQHIRIRATEQGIPAVTAQQVVTPRRAPQAVSTVKARDLVIPVAAPQIIICGIAGQMVGTIRAGQDKRDARPVRDVVRHRHAVDHAARVISGKQVWRCDLIQQIAGQFFWRRVSAAFLRTIGLQIAAFRLWPRHQRLRNKTGPHGAEQGKKRKHPRPLTNKPRQMAPPYPPLFYHKTQERSMNTPRQSAIFCQFG